MSYSTLFKLHSRDLGSEAEVETRLLQPLFNDLGYPATAVIPKQHLPKLIVSSGSQKSKGEADFLLIGHDGYAKVVVEAKDPAIPVQEAWGQAASYALAYNKDKKEDEKVRWLLISNGHITSLYKHDSDSPSITLNLSDFVSGSPPYVSLRSQIKYKIIEVVETGQLEFKSLPPDELNNKFKECHNLIWKKEKLAPADAFYEFCKFIFIKIRADKARELGGTLETYKLPLTLAWLEAQKTTSKHPVRDILFKQLKDDLEDAIVKAGKKRIFESNETFKLTAETTKELIKRFESINLSSIDDDLNGRMFEVFLNAAVRGRELGQYFTPRPLVDFMTRISLHSKGDLTQHLKVIDACCGTAGFLIEVMAYLTAAIRNDTRFNETQKKEMVKKIHNESLFGVEANERVSRIARINMYLHGDGGSHIFHGDGLDNAPLIFDDMSSERKDEVKDHTNTIKEDDFDIVLTNPPFSMSYSKDNDDEERILRQLNIAEGSNSVKSGVLFLQRYLNLLKPGGEMLIVLDDTVLNGATYLKERQWLLDNFVLLGVHSMPFNAFFKAKANIKTSILHIRKKINPEETQGYVIMSISNNIGHDNSLNDTPERNNLPDILNVYFEWKRTGKLEELIKPNQDKFENLECAEQVWLVDSKELTHERIDAFYYAPELKRVKAELEKMEKSGTIILRKGGYFEFRDKISPREIKELRDSGEKLRYIEIGDVTRYGLITKYITGTIDELPSRGEYRIHKGDILMAINNSSRGTVVRVPDEYDGAVCTSGFFVIHPRSEEESCLLWYALRSDYCRHQIYYLSQTASQPELKVEAWEKEFYVPIPLGASKEKAIKEALQFQDHIAALLDADSVRLT